MSGDGFEQDFKQPVKKSERNQTGKSEGWSVKPAGFNDSSAYYSKLRKQAIQRPASSPKVMGSVLSTLGDSLGINSKVREMAVLRLWDEVVPTLYKPYSRAVSLTHDTNIRGWVMRVKVTKAPAATELGMMTEVLLEKLNAFAPQTGFFLKRLRFQVDAKARF